MMPVMALLRDPRMQKVVFFYVAMMSFTTGIAAASGRLITMYGNSASVDATIYVPLVIAGGAFIVASVLAALGNDHVKVGFPLRCCCLTVVCVTLCVPGLRAMPAFWTLVLAMAGYGALSVKACTRAIFLTSPRGSEGTACGAMFSVGGVINLIVSQLVTYLLPLSEPALLATTLVMAVFCVVGDSWVTHVLARGGSFGVAADGSEGTPLVERRSRVSP
jgi:hypothetical protein